MSWQYNFVNPLDELSRKAPYLVNYPALSRRVFNFLVGNPFTPQGRLSWGLFAGKVAGAYAVKRAYSYMTRPIKKARTGSYPVPQKQYSGPSVVMPTPVVGNTGVVQRRQRTERLKSGRLGRKLQAESEDYVYRFSRVYQFGQNTDAYPSNITQATNPTSGGRLQLTHVTSGNPGTGSQVNVMPYYMMDLTSSRWSPVNPAATGGTPGLDCSGVLKRLQFDASGVPQWIDVYTQRDNGSLSSENLWQVEETAKVGTSTFAYPNYPEKKSVLSWADLRLAVYGAREHTSKVYIEFVQFKDEKFLSGYHRYSYAGTTVGDEDFASLTSINKNEVLGFWQNEVRRSVYHPMDAYEFNRNMGIRVLFSRKIVLNPDDSTNLDISPPVQIVKLFKRFNRLCRWSWQQPTPEIEVDKGELDMAGWNPRTGSLFLPFLDPKARVYVIIRCEDFTPVDSTAALSVPASGPAGTITRTVDTTYPTTCAYPTAISPDPTSRPASDVQDNPTSSAFPGVETGINAYVPYTDAQVTGHQWQYTAISGNHYALAVPNFAPKTRTEVITETAGGETAAQWCTAGCPSFDLIVRVKHRIQN